ncbi:biotin synthase BioB [Desulfonatronum sp. SC1]|uniref:biotin synthase BioB n=1 Tax=Desulfonatronum sp. SC1 TaxID=2109626 RepID=UPI000D31E704|nr:biotin synthase BioB [Desulfonatronum sp. SC1]PTN36991.1 biotin synthase BioB [Desulfonatronum sp. SC1]
MNEPILKQAADISLGGDTLPRELADALARLDGEAVLDLVALANRVRNRFAPPFQACSIINAKSGACSEQCRFCAQAGTHATHAETYPLLSAQTIADAAHSAYESGVRSFCIVTSGYGMPRVDSDFEQVLKAIDTIRARCPGMGVSASLGMLGEETARLLVERGIEHYNINLQTAPERYAELITRTHSVQERIDTIKLFKPGGVMICSGGILGTGETMNDRLSLAFTLGELAVDIIPLNILVPIQGTPLENQPPLPAIEVVRTVALFRLINPRAVIKLAAGRESVMNDFQGLLMLAGASGFITGGYLTTRGRSVERDIAFRRELDIFASAAETVP